MLMAEYSYVYVCICALMGRKWGLGRGVRSIGVSTRAAVHLLFKFVNCDSGTYMLIR